jgi:DNA-binding transcriptional LysR family regulator
MSPVNLGRVDLNLLHVLFTVLETRSATRAAQRLHVTQSAVSNALRRAREVFGDPLLLRKPHGLEPTPRAATLEPALRAWLEGARRLIEDAPAFEAETSERTFRVACSDAVSVALLEPILRLLRRRAPRSKLRLVTLDRLIAEDGLERGEVDLLIGIPPVMPDGYQAELVYRDPFACLVRRGHRRVGKRLGLATYAALPHVDLALFDAVDETVDRALAQRGLSRRVAVALPHFSAIPLAVVGSDCVATLSSRLAHAFAARYPLRVVAPPIRLEPIEIRQVWHRRSDGDRAVTFLRDLVREAAQATTRRR